MEFSIRVLTLLITIIFSVRIEIWAVRPIFSVEFIVSISLRRFLNNFAQIYRDPNDAVPADYLQPHFNRRRNQANQNQPRERNLPRENIVQEPVVFGPQQAFRLRGDVEPQANIN